MTTTRKRLLASSLLCGAALMGGLPAAAQSTQSTVGNPPTSGTQSQGQFSPTTNPQAQPQPGAGGFAAPADAAGPANPGPAPTTAAGQASEVVVTGTRIARRDYVSDSPIVTVGPKAIENTGSVTLDKLINQIPQFVPGLGSQNNNPGTGQVNIELRGLGTTRTLVLVDGRRTTPSNVDGTVDINTIPSALIENIEVVTGGQSTSYGSDAIAGVVNFKLKHNFQGVVVDANYGRTDANDGAQQSITATLGSNFADDRGNATISLGYANRDAVFYGQRPNVTRDDYATIAGSVDPRLLAVSGLSGTRPQGGISFIGSNLPTNAAIGTLFTGYGVPASSVAALTNGANGRSNGYVFGFNNDGTLFNGAANYRGPTTIDYSTITRLPTASNGGSYNTGALNYIQLPQTRYQAFATGEFAITPHIKAYAQFNFTDYTSATELAPSPASGNPGVGGTGFLVPANNPFISTDLRSLLNSRVDPNAPFLFSKRFSAIGARHSADEFTTYQELVGVKGDIPGYDLTYDIFASYGHFNDTNTQTGNVSHANYAAVLANPTTAGAGACSTYNPFGVSSITAACRSFLSPATKNQTQYTQRIVEADFQGKVFTLPSYDLFGGSLGGGDVRFAAGADYRSDEASFLPDALLSSQDRTTNSYTLGGTTYNLTNNTSGVVGFNGGLPVNGRIDVYETYVELLVPIVKNLPLFRSVDLDLGGRYSDYSTVSSIYTYKADLQWKLTSWFSARGGYSRAVRAPNVSELFTPASNGFFDIGSPSATGLGQGDPCDVRGAARMGVGGINATAVRNLCLAQGVPASVIDSYRAPNSQVQELAGGNPNLRQERANTYTGGFVVQPKFGMALFRNISASVDYYNIEINGFVSSVGPSTQLNKCFNTDGSNPTYSNSYSLCSLFTRDPATGDVVSGFNNLQNLGAIRTSGVDFQFDWRFGLSAVPYANLSDHFGSLALNFTASWLNDFDVQQLPGDRFINQRGYAGNGVDTVLPVWKALVNVDYTVGPIDVGVVERYVGDAKDGSCAGITTPCTARGVDPTFYTDINARWRINDMFELRGGVTNATNQDPRFYSSGSASQGLSNAATYDFLGRAYFLAIKARF